MTHLVSTTTNLIRRAWQQNAPLTGYSIAMLVLLLFTTLGLIVDPRVITGQPAWLKPTKFAISTLFYAMTLVWLMGFIEGRTRVKRLITWATTIGLAIEMIIIVLQTARGVSSHFNYTTLLDAVLFQFMAVFIVVVWSMNLVLAVGLFLQRFTRPTLAWALRLGTVIGFIGAGLAFYMTAPNAAQLAQVQATGEMPVIGAHSVGVPDGGPGLPFVGWSTEGGDVRPAHFFGLHGLQALPLIGYLVMLLPMAWLREGHRVALVWVSGLSYLGFVMLTFWQALRGQPLLAPDSLTLAALAGLVSITALAGVAVVVHARWALAKVDLAAAD